MDFIQTIKRLQPHYPICSICALPQCTHPHRFFAYHGYLEYLDSTIDPAAPGREGERQVFMSNLAKVEFGFKPEDRVEECTVCYKDGCENLHRTLTREGYARFVREVQGVQSAEEAVLMADEMFGDGDGLGGLDDVEAALGGRAQRYRDALRGLSHMEATLRDLDDVEAAIGSRTQGYGAGLGSLGGMKVALGSRAQCYGAGLGDLNDMEAALGGRTQDYGAAFGGLNDMEATLRDANATLRGLEDMEAAFASQTQGYGTGLGSLDDIEAALGGRTTDGTASGSLDDKEDTLRMCTRGGGGGSYGEEGFTGAADEGSEYHTEFDGLLEWDIRNEIIHLAKKWEEAREFETFGQYFKYEWIRKADGYPKTYRAETPAPMPWDDMTWDQQQALSLPPHPQPPPPPPPPTLERSTTPPLLTDEQYEKARRSYYGRWQRFVPRKSREQKDAQRPLIQASWERRVGARGREENMPWHVDFFSRPYRPLVSPPWDPSRGWVSEEDKLPFRKEWEDMAFGKDGKLNKDPMQRYALERLVQAAFVSAVGPRGETEVMPWTPDLVRPEPAAAGLGQEESLNTPLPDTSLEADYTTLRSEYALIYVNRIKGEDQKEVERVAGVFREAWVQEVGVRANDVSMPWDEVLGKREVVQEEVRDVVDEGGVGDGKFRERPRRRVGGWTRRKGRCEFQ
ncbi:hypothetical protein VE02_02791 [Pseudogymnoascus sp. 03VT05]|nr:hypothetical protein VE02_02791 [Pseudogymnoascus sp. 03VT05]